MNEDGRKDTDDVNKNDCVDCRNEDNDDEQMIIDNWQNVPEHIL